MPLVLLVLASCQPGDTVQEAPVGPTTVLAGTFTTGPATFGTLTIGEAGGAWERVGTRAERRLPGMTEWWVEAGLGYEHGFDVSAGGDHLRIVVPVSGATLAERGGVVTLTPPGARRLAYQHLVAIDAAGHGLDAAISVAGQDIVLDIDTAGAT